MRSNTVLLSHQQHEEVFCGGGGGIVGFAGWRSEEACAGKEILCGDLASNNLGSNRRERSDFPYFFFLMNYGRGLCEYDSHKNLVISPKSFSFLSNICFFSNEPMTGEA